MYARSFLCLLIFLAASASAADHRVEILAEGPPTDKLSDAISKTLALQGMRVVSETGRTVCEIWPCKQLDAKPGFKASGEVLYPFQPGQLIGALHFRRRGSDFRDQDISRGVYTLRYAQQPVDGNHEGTSPTRDFLVMVKAEDDKAAGVIATEELMAASAEAAQSSHPAMLCLQKPQVGETEKLPSMRHNEDHDWWVLQFTGKTKGGQLAIDLVVAGHATE